MSARDLILWAVLMVAFTAAVCVAVVVQFG